MRLDSYLVHVGLGSKKEMKQAIKRKLVYVNGKIATSSDMKILPTSDLVTFDNKIVDYQEHYYYMYYKPAGVVCSKLDGNNEALIDKLPQSLINQGVFSVGRLDKDTTGLLLLTTDGIWDHKIRHPKAEKEKCYYIEYRGVLKNNAKILVEKGIDLGDFITLPGNLEILRNNSAYLTIKEGKFHQVKRMIKALGAEVVYLHRISIGKVYLDLSLKEGDYRPLTREEIISLGG